MAKTKGAPARTNPLALELLETDHRNVERLFEQYEHEKESDDGTKRDIATRICAELSAHAQLEEEFFYPWLRDHLEEDDMELLEEAYVEHETAKDLIAQIEGEGDLDAAFDAKVKVLSEYIKHHVEEEENEIFKKVRSMHDELDALGQEMHSRKAELMEELGIEAGPEDDEEVSARALEKKGAGTRAQPGRSR